MGVEAELTLAVAYNLTSLPYFYDLSDETDYAGLGIALADVRGNFEIIDPLGQSYINTSWVTPDIHMSINTSFDGANIRLNGSNFPYSGSYTFRYTVQVSGAVEPGTYIKDFPVVFSYVRPTVSIEFDNNPYLATLTARDITSYLVDGVSPTQTRVMTLIYPPASAIPDTTGSGTYLTASSPYYVNGLYSCTVSDDVTYSFDDYSVIDSLSGLATITVTDIVNIKSVYCCLKNLNTQAMAVRLTNPQRYEELIAILGRATSLMVLFNMAVQLGEYTDASIYQQQIYTITGCSENCSC